MEDGMRYGTPMLSIEQARALSARVADVVQERDHLREEIESLHLIMAELEGLRALLDDPAPFVTTASTNGYLATATLSGDDRGDCSNDDPLYQSTDRERPPADDTAPVPDNPPTDATAAPTATPRDDAANDRDDRVQVRDRDERPAAVHHETPADDTAPDDDILYTPSHLKQPDAPMTAPIPPADVVDQGDDDANMPGKDDPGDCPNDKFLYIPLHLDYVETPAANAPDHVQTATPADGAELVTNPPALMVEDTAGDCNERPAVKLYTGKSSVDRHAETAADDTAPAPKRVEPNKGT